MFDDKKRYDDEDIYEEDFIDNDDDYEIDAPDYLEDDDEDENALWDDEDTADTDIEDTPEKKRRKRMPQPTKAIISNEQKSGIRKGSNRASTGKVGALLLSVYIV